MTEDLTESELTPQNSMSREKSTISDDGPIPLKIEAKIS